MQLLFKRLTAMKNLALDNQEKIVLQIIIGDRPYTDGYTKGHYSYREGKQVGMRRTKWHEKATQSLIDRGIISPNPETRLLEIIEPAVIEKI